MTFVEAIQSAFSNYVNFSGRAQRSAFWYWVLFGFIGGIVVSHSRSFDLRYRILHAALDAVDARHHSAGARGLGPATARHQPVRLVDSAQLHPDRRHHHSHHLVGQAGRAGRQPLRHEPARLTAASRRHDQTCRLSAPNPPRPFKGAEFHARTRGVIAEADYELRVVSGMKKETGLWVLRKQSNPDFQTM